jgi:hypothetical protein
VLAGGGGGNIGLLPDAVPRAASALLNASSKAAATKMENEGFIWTTSMQLNGGGA